MPTVSQHSFHDAREMGSGRRTRDGFDSRAGSRGVPASPGRLWSWMDTQMRRRAVRRVFAAFGFDALVLTTVGRRSGVERTAVVCWFPHKGGGYLVVAAAGGTASNPAWYHNVAAHPDRVRIEIDGSTMAVSAEQLRGAERAEAWQQITAAARRFARFQDKTDRELPVILLEPRPDPAQPRQAGPAAHGSGS